MSDTSSSPIKIKRFVSKNMSQLSCSPNNRSSSKINKRRLDTSCNCCETLQKEMKAMREDQKTFAGQMQLMVEAIAEQKALLRHVVRQQAQEAPLNKKFPLLNEEQLITLNNDISDENRQLYVKAMNSIIQPGGILKNLKHVLCEEIIINYNVDGIHGKKSLKALVNFHRVLLDAIPITPTSDSAEVLLRKSIMLMKKRYFKRVCVEKKNSNM